MVTSVARTGVDMNERIRELAHEAGLPTYNPAGIPTKLEKFAELIVKECIKLCDQVDLVGADDCIDNIKEHFEMTQSASPLISPANMRARCEVLVIAMVGKALADKWWNGPNKAFGGDTPEQMYSVAPDTVYAYLMKSLEGDE